MGLNNYIEVRCLECGVFGCADVIQLFGAPPEEILCCCCCNSEKLQTRWGPLWPWKGPPVTVEDAMSDYRAWAQAHARAQSQRRQTDNS
jgi:hypothetical protein